MAHGYDKGSTRTRLDIWTDIEARTGREMEGVKPPEFPPELQYIWNEYIELRKGGEDLNYRVLDSYQRVSGSYLTPWEAAIMLEVDMVRRRNAG